MIDVAPEAIYFRDEQERPPLQKAVDAYNIAATEILVKTHPRGLLEFSITLINGNDCNSNAIIMGVLLLIDPRNVRADSNNPRG